MEGEKNEERMESKKVGLDPQPFQVVLKGGSPWGFTLKGGVEVQSPIQISQASVGPINQQIEPNSKADLSDKLHPDDYVLSINHVTCQSLTEAVQLIQDAFRTLTLTIWRGTSKLESSVKILRSSSFLQRAREVQERERQRLGLQDDSIVPREGSGSAGRTKQRTRRIESFHGRPSRLRHASNSTTSSQEPPSPRPSLSSGTTDPPNHDEGSVSRSKFKDQVGIDKLKGWGTVQDLSHKQRPTSSIHGDTSSANHNAAYKSSGQLSPAMSSPTLSMTDQLSHGNHSNRQPSPRLQMMPSRSSPDFSDSVKQTSTSPGSFDSRLGSQYPAGFRKIEWSANQHGNKENMVHSQTGYSAYKTNEDRGNSGYLTQEVRRSMPAPQIKPFLHDYQNINDFKSSVNDTESNVDKELQKLTTGAPPQGYDPRPLCSPPAPPVRDVSSMKFANHMQSHEKYPSWPVTQPSMETEGGEPITSPKFHPQLGTVKERNNSPSSDKKNGDEYKRNASDPGFKKTYPFSNFIKRPKVTDKEAKVNNEEMDKCHAEKIDDFFNSQPGYPQPQMDQDGHRIGDEKYSIPSPPERENQAPDTKTLSEKIASIVRPHHDVGYIKDAPPRRRSDRGASPQRSPQDKKPGEMFARVGASVSTNASVGDSSPFKGQALVDTGTSPLNSPSESKFSSPNSAAQLFKASTDRLSETRVHNKHSYIVKQMVCYNTGTQTEFAGQESADTPKSSSRIKDYGEQNFADRSTSARLSSSGSEREYVPGDHVRRTSSRGSDVRRTSSRSDRYGASDHSHRENRRSIGDNDEMAPMLRKLTREYYGGKLHGSLNEKRLSSGSSQDSSLRSPGSDIPFGQYGGLREAESCSSVVIHPDGNSLPFGRDYAESRSSVSDSRHDMGVGMENERTNMSSEPKSAFKPGRHSLDPTMFSPKYPLISAGNKPLHDSRYSSEANLQSSAYGGPREHMRSMTSLSGRHSKSSSVSEETSIHGMKHSFDSSPPSQPHSSSDTRSSASTHYSSDGSPFVGQTQGHGQGQFRTRKESSDSVFTDSPHSRTLSSSDTLNPLPKRPNDLNFQGRMMGRSASMKKAYGVYDESERSYSTSGAHHRKQESDVTSNASHSLHGGVAHLRSHSKSEYIPMDQYRRMQAEGQGQGHHMALIREDSSEMRWEEAVRKSRGGRKASNSSSDHESNYANVDIHKNSLDSAKLEGYQHIDSYNKSRSEGRLGTNLKRTSSEQIRPMKERLRYSEKDSVGENKAGKPTSVGGATENVKSLSDFKSSDSPADVGQRVSSGAKQTLQVSSASQPISSQGEAPSPSPSQKSASDGSVKDESNKSSQPEVRPGSESGDSRFVNGNSVSSSASDLKTKQRNAVQEYVERVTQKKLSDSGEDENSASRDISLVGDVDKAPESSKLTPTESFRQKYGSRAERAESLRRSRSVSSRDASEYVEMKRPDKPHPPTEWSRIRSQTGGSRPHSIGSDSSLVDPYAVTPLSSMKDLENHQRSQSDSTTSGLHSTNDRSPLDQHQDDDDDSSSNISKSSLIYQNVGYRRPPPVPPPDSEDAPPALPPRNYKSYVNPMPDPSRYPRHSGEHARIDDMGGDSGRSKARWEGSSTNTPDNYAEQLRRQARRLSEQQQHMPPPMSYISSKVQINYSQSYKRPAVEALEATPPGGHPESPAPQSPVSPKHTPSTESSPSHHAPLKIDIHPEVRAPPTSPRAAWRSTPTTLPSPDPPPPPTPQKEDVIHLAGDELPPPPPEVVNAGSDEQNSDKYAEDSYAGYRNRASRQPGVYKRSASSSDALKLLRENNNYKQQSDIPNIPKPPRKRLQQQGWKSEQDMTVAEQTDETPETADVVPTFTATESVPAQIPPRSVPPRPLGHSHSANYLFSPKPYNSPESSPAPNVVRGVPVSQVEERTSVPEHTESKTNDVTERNSVQDRINQLNKHPSQGASDRAGKHGFSNVGNLKRAFEEQGRSPDFVSPEIPSSRRSYEPPPSSGRKFASSYSESRLTRSPKDSIPVPETVSKSPEMSRSFVEKRDFVQPGPLSPRRPSAPSSFTEMRVSDRAVKTSDATVPPPVDRSAESGYPGSLYRRDSFQNRHPSRDKSASFSETKNINSPVQVAEQTRDDWKSSVRSGTRNLDQSGTSLHSPSVQSNSEISSRDHHRAQQENLESNNDDNKTATVESSPQKSATVSDASTSSSVHVHNRQPSAEELEADAKVQEFADQFKDADPKLSTVLKPETSVNRMKYMDGIFRVDVEIVPRHSPKSSPKSSTVSQDSGVIENGEIVQQTPNKEKDQVEKGENEKNETSPLPHSYWMSPSKAMIEMDIRKSEDMGKEMTQHIGDSDTLIKTKEELVNSIQKKLDKLKEEKDELILEIEEIEKVGKQVQLAVNQKCRSQQEKDKYKTCIVDMEKIILLLLKLSGLLARAENAYQSLPENADARQKKFAIDKRDRLQKQYEEAKDLKDDIDKRSKQVTTFLQECFCESEMEDYHYYIKMKSKLTIEKQELEDKLTLGEEQITALRRSIPSGKY